jgi:hypothetical protein
MKKLLALLALIFLVNACSTLNELIALTKCEFRLHSLQQPAVCGIDISQKNSWSDFSFTEGQAIAGKLLQKSFPFDITVHMEVLNVDDRESQVSVKIKPSVLIGTRELRYPDYFTLTREFKSGN